MPWNPLGPGALPPRPLPTFDPHQSTVGTGGTVDPVTSPPGVLAQLAGSWAGEGLNVIWTPSQESQTGSAHFLQLAATSETLDVALLDGTIPNRGLDQADLFMAGARYTQQIESDGKAVHFEHGVWLNVPATTVPPVGETVARMASIPHGTTIDAQGMVTQLPGGPVIPPAPITPFTMGAPGALVSLPQESTAPGVAFRTPDPVDLGFDDEVLRDVNTFLRRRLPTRGSTVTQIDVSSVARPEVPGGGVANTAFLLTNANTREVRQSIWLFTEIGAAEPFRLLYSQTVLLDFSGLSWPHVTVGVLDRSAGVTAG